MTPASSVIKIAIVCAFIGLVLGWLVAMNSPFSPAPAAPPATPPATAPR
ncbi:hypothetical protein ACQP2F_11590 [Actinoplanes sp. CA-030573]